MNRQSLMVVSPVLYFGDKPYLAVLSGTYTFVASSVTEVLKFCKAGKLASRSPKWDTREGNGFDHAREF